MTEAEKAHAHRLLRILLWSSYINVFAFSLFGPLFSLYVHGLGATIPQISRLLAVYSLVFGVGLFVFGRLQNHIVNKRVTVVTGFFLLAAGAFAYLFVHSPTSAYLVQIGNAIACAWFSPAWKSIYGRTLHEGRETEGWGKIDGGTQVLAAVATAIGGGVVATIGFPALIVTVGVLQLAAGFFSLQILG